MTPSSPNSPLFSALRDFAPVREPSSSPTPIARRIPIRFFATPVAVQKKNSLCEPNFENAQPHDPKGAQHEIAEKFGYEVAQADGRFSRSGLRSNVPAGPHRRFATPVAVQKKNSPCEPNLETTQPHDLKGAQHENAGNPGYQVAQADGMTKPTLRAFASVREPASSPTPIVRRTPIRCFATLVAVQKNNSRCEPNRETTQPNDPKGAQHEIAEKFGYEVAQADGRFSRSGLRSNVPAGPHHPPRQTSPRFRDTRRRGKKTLPNEPNSSTG